LSAIAFRPASVTVSASVSQKEKAANIWQIAPPEPVIPEAERLKELAARRAAVMKQVGEKGILVLFSAEPRIYTNDVDYHYRQENNLYYLTGIKQEGAILVLLPGAKKTREILFMPRPVPSRETWDGHMLTIEETRARSGIQEVWNYNRNRGQELWDNSLFNSLMASFAPAAAAALTTPNARPNTSGPSASNDAAERIQAMQEDLKPLKDAVSKNEGGIHLLTGGDQREYRQESAFAAKLAPAAPGLTVKSARQIFGELRWRKSPWEVSLVQRAIDITSEAFHRVFAMVAPGVHEYEVQAEFEYTYRRRHADNWGYPCIVGGGANATTLHYITNQDRLAPGSLLLMDCSAEYDHYTGDITRTIPVSGKFTKEQADIYRIVYEASVEAIKRARPGVMMSGGPDSVHGRATEIVKEGLLRLGLITSKDNDEYRTWFMHGTCHWIGMNVHDVSGRGPLGPGMMFTVEPGIYIRPDALDVLPKTPQNEKFIQAVRPAFEKYKGIGVRIEDDILVTEGEPKNMSAAIPSKLEDVEAVMALLKQEMNRTRLP
jgi:Xaa-Pro aminopeptidase